MGLLEKAYALEDKIAEWFSRKFTGKYLRVLLYAQKPDSEELSHLTRVSLLGLVFVGAVGFFMYLLFYYAFHINLRSLFYSKTFLFDISVLPYRCTRMLKDHYGRPLLAIRALLTSRCNYLCFFCHREGARGNEPEISPEDWKKIFEAASSLGVKEVKFTGGEPLLYKDLSKVLKYAGESFSSISMTTNGYFLEENWKTLADNGVRINLSLHSLDPERYKRITGVDGLEKVLRGLERAIGDLDVKVNFLALKGINVDEIWRVIEFCGERGIKLQLIEYEALLGRGNYYFSLGEVEEELKRRALAIRVRRQHGKKVYFLPNQVEVLRTWRNSTLCERCTRIRILSNGEAIPCIFRSDDRVSLLEDPVEGIKKVNSLRKPYWRRSEDGDGRHFEEGRSVKEGIGRRFHKA